ncbi:MAG: MaoC family dehydratase [Betaproteobacteria bacterium]
MSIDATVPIDDRHFEDYVQGSSAMFGPIAMTEEAIVAFARQYDPQSIHIDPVGAAAGPFGGLISSGWHTVCVVMRELVQHYLAGPASLASPGVDELRWMKPVRPGDMLRVRVTVVSTQRSRSKPDRGMVRTSIETLNQRDEIVMSMIAMNLFRCRERAGDRPGAH